MRLAWAGESSREVCPREESSASPRRSPKLPPCLLLPGQPLLSPPLCLFQVVLAVSASDHFGLETCWDCLFWTLKEGSLSTSSQSCLSFNHCTVKALGRVSISTIPSPAELPLAKQGLQGGTCGRAQWDSLELASLLHVTLWPGHVIPVWTCIFFLFAKLLFL